MKHLIQKIHYNSSVPLLWSILTGLPSLCYLLFINFKNLLYKLKILKEQKVNAKVICIGNITTGGVGKTPVVCAVANYLTSKGEKVAVISRGYGGRLDNSDVNVVKDYNEILINDALLCGDEPYLIAQNTKDVPVLTCKDRMRACKYAIEHFNVQTLVFDDGFSNRKVHKDINILLVDCEKKFGNSFVLPMGPLREPLSEIKRSQKLVLVNKNTDEKKAQKELVSLKRYNIPVYPCKMVKDKYYNLLTNDEYTPSKYPDAAAFCAIGQPEQFYNYLADDFCLVSTKDFSDHHIYSREDIQKLSSLSNILITTEKDAVKIIPLIDKVSFPTLLVLKLKLELDLDGLLNE